MPLRDFSGVQVKTHSGLALQAAPYHQWKTVVCSCSFEREVQRRRLLGLLHSSGEGVIPAKSEVYGRNDEHVFLAGVAYELNTSSLRRVVIILGLKNVIAPRGSHKQER